MIDQSANIRFFYVSSVVFCDWLIYINGDAEISRESPATFWPGRPRRVFFLRFLKILFYLLFEVFNILFIILIGINRL